jgi:hypothetical protein
MGTAVGVTDSSSAAALKLSRREADSKARKAVSGNEANIDFSTDEMDSSRLIFAHLND